MLYIVHKNGAKNRIHLLTGMEKESCAVWHSREHNNATIVKFFNLTMMWVWKVRNQLKKSGGDYEAVAKRSDHQKRSDCLRTAKFINRVKNAIDKDLGKLMHVIAKDMRMSEALIPKMCVRGLEVQVLQNQKRPITDSQGQGEVIESVLKTSQQTQTSSAVQHDLVLL